LLKREYSRRGENNFQATSILLHGATLQVAPSHHREKYTKGRGEVEGKLLGQWRRWRSTAPGAGQLKKVEDGVWKLWEGKFTRRHAFLRRLIPASTLHRWSARRTGRGQGRAEWGGKIGNIYRTPDYFASSLSDWGPPDVRMLSSGSTR